jgi:hypothetical protein
MPDIVLSDLQPTTAATAVDNSIAFLQTTATPFITPTLSSVTRASSNTAFSSNYNINNLDSPVTGNRSSVPGILSGRRPRFGQLFPRGYFNR